MKYVLKVVISIFIFNFAYSEQITEKPFILEHIYHEHKIDLTNTSVYQQIDKFGALYNVTNIFFTYKFTPHDHIFIGLSIALGNGIVPHTQKLSYSIEPTGANLENYIENINDTGRKHITEAWYHKIIDRFDFVVGIIDSASFVDENEYANDENIQFLNNAFTNNPLAPIPSFNPGVYLRYSTDHFEYKLLYMENKPDKGNFGVFQVNIKDNSYNLRPYLYKVFNTQDNTSGIGFSSDFSTANTGYFIRMGASFNDKEYLYSIGFQRHLYNNDSIAFAAGVIEKEKSIYILETYYTKDITPHFSTTFDIQYMKENKEDIIFGIRAYLSY